MNETKKNPAKQKTKEMKSNPKRLRLSSGRMQQIFHLKCKKTRESMNTKTNTHKYELKLRQTEW